MAAAADDFTDLFDRHSRAVYNYCFRRTADWALAEDLTSAVFLEAWRRRADMRPATARPWLFGIATNLLRNQRRSLRRHAAALRRVPALDRELDFADDLAARLDAERQARELVDRLNRLSRRQRDVIGLCLLARLTYEEAAAALGIPVGTVRSRLARARRELAEHAAGRAASGTARDHEWSVTMRPNDDLRLPPEFDMPPARMQHRRELLVAELTRAGSPRHPRRSRRRLALTLAAAGCAAVAAVPAVDLIGSDGSGRGVVEKAVAAVSSDEAIYHVVTLFTVRHRTDDPRVLDAFDFDDVDLFEDVTQYSEAWIGPANRNRTLLYDATGGQRGRLLQESAWDGLAGYAFDARSNTVTVMRPRRAKRPNRPPLRPRGAVQPELMPGADPAQQLRRLHAQGRLTLAGTETVRGRSAYRLVSDTFVDPTEKGHTERVEFLVDAETYLPLQQRNISTQLGVSGLPKDLRPPAELYETPVTSTATRTFLTYEKLPASRENLALLEPRPRPGATVFDPHAPPREP